MSDREDIAGCTPGEMKAVSGASASAEARFRCHWTHLSCRQQLSSGRHEVGHGKQAVQVRGVLGQAAIADLGVAELAFDNPKRMLDPGSQRRQTSVGGALPFQQRLAGTAHVRRDDARSTIGRRGIQAAARASIAGIAQHDAFFAVQQGFGLGDVGEQRIFS